MGILDWISLSENNKNLDLSDNNLNLSDSSIQISYTDYQPTFYTGSTENPGNFFRILF